MGFAGNTILKQAHIMAVVKKSGSSPPSLPLHCLPLAYCCNLYDIGGGWWRREISIRTWLQHFIIMPRPLSSLHRSWWFYHSWRLSPLSCVYPFSIYFSHSFVCLRGEEGNYFWTSIFAYRQWITQWLMDPGGSMHSQGPPINQSLYFALAPSHIRLPRGFFPVDLWL